MDGTPADNPFQHQNSGKPLTITFILRRVAIFYSIPANTSRMMAPMSKTIPDDYELLDSGHGRKLERFGPHILIRPCAAAVWEPSIPPDQWKADASFDREDGHAWTVNRQLPDSWNITVADIRFRLSTTDFGHLGIFPEQRDAWQWIRQTLQNTAAKRTGPLSVLNLFAYSGGATMAAAQAGASVCHLDASKGMVARARENATLNELATRPIRWIVDDVTKFLDREIRRGTRYDAIILDPPSFGRGKSGEVYKIESNLPNTLRQCASLLSAQPCFVLLSCHTPAFSPLILQNLLSRGLKGGSVESGEMALIGKPGVPPLPHGTWSRWKP